jgi:hypothetical protein
MNGRTTLILLALAVALGAYLYFAPASDPESDIADEVTTEKVLTFESRQVNAMTITQVATGGEVTVNRTANGWDITTDATVAGDEITIGPAVATIAGLNADSVIPAVTDFGVYGLTTPQLTIELRGESGVLATLAIGERNPSGGARYVRVDNQDQVYVVSDYVLDTVEEWFTLVPLAPTALPTLAPNP